MLEWWFGGPAPDAVNNDVFVVGSADNRLGAAAALAEDFYGAFYPTSVVLSSPSSLRIDWPCWVRDSIAALDRCFLVLRVQEEEEGARGVGCYTLSCRLSAVLMGLIHPAYAFGFT